MFDILNNSIICIQGLRQILLMIVHEVIITFVIKIFYLNQNKLFATGSDSLFVTDQHNIIHIKYSYACFCKQTWLICGLISMKLKKCEQRWMKWETRSTRKMPVSYKTCGVNWREPIRTAESFSIACERQRGRECDPQKPVNLTGNCWGAWSKT